MPKVTTDNPGNAALVVEDDASLAVSGDTGQTWNVTLWPSIFELSGRNPSIPYNLDYHNA